MSLCRLRRLRKTRLRAKKSAAYQVFRVETQHRYCGGGLFSGLSISMQFLSLPLRQIERYPLRPNIFHPMPNSSGRPHSTHLG